MDPFEARLQFIQILEQLNPSHVYIVKAVQFCLKNEELHEDFHSCILEVLDRIDLNAKINVLYFLQSLVSMVLENVSNTEELGSLPYVKNIKKDLKIMLEKIIPGDNLINLRNSVDILINLEKLYGIRNVEYVEKYMTLELPDEDTQNEKNVEVTDIVKDERQEITNDEVVVPKKEEEIDTHTATETTETTIPEEKSTAITTNEFIACWELLIGKKLSSLKNRKRQLIDKTDNNNNDENPELSLTRDQILSRMETDRERHKRSKETSWIVNRNNGINGPSFNVNKNGIDLVEFDKIWDKFGAINKEDLRELRELNEIAKDSYLI